MPLSKLHMDGLFVHDIGDALYQSMLESSGISDLAAMTRLKSVCVGAYKGVNQSWGRHSDRLKKRLLQELQRPNIYGGLWCWVIPAPSVTTLPRRGKALRLVGANSVLGSENTFFTFRTSDSFVAPQPDDDGSVTLHLEQFLVVWMGEGQDLSTGQLTTGRALEMEYSLAYYQRDSDESSDETQLYGGEQVNIE